MGWGGGVVSIHAVAKQAKVSPATVSRVLNNSGYVSDGLRRAVEEAVALLGYRPNVHARRLRGKRSKMIGLVFTNATYPFFAAVALAVEDIARQNGYSVVLGNTHGRIEAFDHYLETFASYDVDGLIVVPPGAPQQHRPALDALTIPYVLLDKRIRGLAVDQVATDNVAGATRMTEHLLAIGHRRIAFVGGDPRLPTARERAQGYRRALLARGVGVDKALIRMHDFSEESGFALTRALLRESRPEAIFAANFNVLLGALRAVRGAGLAIPDDVAVVGFDDIPFVAAVAPILTVIAQQSRAIGIAAAQLLLDKLGGTRALAEHRTVLLQPELIVRESCGARRRGLARATILAPEQPWAVLPIAEGIEVS